jgi:hypothetical protein
MMHKLVDATSDNNDPTTCPRMVIERNNRIILYWDVISGFSMILSYFLVPYQIAFGGPYSAEGRAIEISLDVVFLITLLLRLITDRYSEPGQNLSGRQVAFNYITGYFIFDLASFFPHLVTKETYLGYSVLYKLKLFRYINLYGTLSQFDDLIFAFGRYLKEHTSYNIRFILSTVIQYTLIFHVMACIWVIIGNCNQFDGAFGCYEEQDGWIKVDRDNNIYSQVPPHR